MPSVRRAARGKGRVAVRGDRQHVVEQPVARRIVRASQLSHEPLRAGGSRENPMKMSAEAKGDLGKRLRRLEGQVHGVHKMLDEDRDCQEIVQQLAAIRSAAHQISLLMVRSYASECLRDGSRSTAQQAINELVDVLTKIP